MTDLQPLQKLSFGISPTPSRDIGEKGELVWLPLGKLFIDPLYQRQILDSGRANVRRMVEGFSWLLFGTVVVARRPGGKFAIIDGQHRATAAILHGGIDAIPCLVLKGGQAAEALAFSAINGNVTRIHVLQSFRAKVAAGDHDARALVELCGRAGVVIASYPKTELQPGETLALGSVRNGLRNYGPDVLLAALRTLRTIDQASGLSAAAITGTGAALHTRPDILKDCVALATKIAAPGKLAGLAEKAASRRVTRGGTEWSNFSAVVAEALTMAARAGSQDMRRLMGAR